MPHPLLTTPRPASLRWGAQLLGFALGGFFDGILLHQILQWHHLLSGIDTRASDLAFQLLADGIFHLAMYAVALAGLALVAGQRRLLPKVRRTWLLAHVLLGFGFWHALDAVLVHWLLGWHRIRMDSAVPLLWDLAWLAAFGLAFLGAGMWLLRRSPEPPGGAGWLAIWVAVLAGAAGAAQWTPWRAPSSMVVMLLPGASPAAVYAVADETGAPVVAALRSGAVWVLAAPAAGAAPPIYRRGTIIASAGRLPAGCYAWIQDGTGSI